MGDIVYLLYFLQINNRVHCFKFRGILPKKVLKTVENDIEKLDIAIKV
jgi:hypothetical protein